MLKRQREEARTPSTLSRMNQACGVFGTHDSLVTRSRLMVAADKQVAGLIDRLALLEECKRFGADRSGRRAVHEAASHGRGARGELSPLNQSRRRRSAA